VEQLGRKEKGGWSREGKEKVREGAVRGMVEVIGREGRVEREEDW
jgi:hypothetical protein